MVHIIFLLGGDGLRKQILSVNVCNRSCYFLDVMCLACDGLLVFWFFKVEISIQSNFQPGMKLEVANKKNPDTYWVATVITTCGQLLLLRYCGYGEDRRADFWCDVVIADLHPVGWCTQNNKTLMPPDGEHGLAQLSGITCDAQRQTS